MRGKIFKVLPLAALALFVMAGISRAEDAPSVAGNAAAIEGLQNHANFLWTLIAAVLVFLMQAGFAMVESGMTRAKNAINIMMKNLMDFSVGSMAFYAVGFGLMFGTTNGFFGTTDFFMSGPGPEGNPDWMWVFFMFQVVFAATAATIVSGAMAERTKFISYIVYSFFISLIIYPIFGSWAWGSLYNGSGWLEGMGFVDFAGSTVVHSVGGWAALAGAIVLGPRLGKYGKNGEIHPIPGHNMPLATLGVFLLWFGWFGFNAGSTTTADTSIALIAVNTSMAAAAGSIAAMIVAWVKTGKAEISMTLNGALAGLVGITAGCANVAPGGAIVIGLIAGVLVYFAVVTIDKLKIDDPVGAVSVHGVCGAWGTLAAGLPFFDTTGDASVMTQLIGIGAAFAWTFTTAFILFKVIDMTIGLRVTAEEEIEGLDFLEHGGHAYPGIAEGSSGYGSIGASGSMAASSASAPVGVPESAS
ncbi:MAG: ammonium transporter [Chrysiogenetes bacterium]|nr:ammonium transporter [Chrysiogenetes bacterium]